MPLRSGLTLLLPAVLVGVRGQASQRPGGGYKKEGYLPYRCRVEFFTRGGRNKKPRPGAISRAQIILSILSMQCKVASAPTEGNCFKFDVFKAVDCFLFTEKGLGRRRLHTWISGHLETPR